MILIIRCVVGWAPALVYWPLYRTFHIILCYCLLQVHHPYQRVYGHTGDSLGQLTQEAVPV